MNIYELDGAGRSAVLVCALSPKGYLVFSADVMLATENCAGETDERFRAP